MSLTCSRAEMLAGAVALGEATPEERAAYRGHIAACVTCLAAFGGEREIERVMTIVQRARDDEHWEPAVTLRRSHRAMRFMRFGVSVVATALAISIGFHVLVAASFGHVATKRDAPIVIDYGGMRITFERRVPHAMRSVPVVAQRFDAHRSAAHSIISAPVMREGVHPRLSTEQLVALAATPPPLRAPVWLNAHDPSASSAAYPDRTARAESIAVVPVVRDAMPIGGDDAIVPRPPGIVYAQGAEGTTVFEVTVDEHGSPTNCTIAKSSGFVLLDAAICRAATRARYMPRTVNGRPTPGVYRDSFTFRSDGSSDR